MRIQAKCGCGATLDLSPDISGSFGSREPSAPESTRLTETFEKWNEAHRNCADLMSRPREIQVPIFHREVRAEVPEPNAEALPQ